MKITINGIEVDVVWMEVEIRGKSAEELFGKETTISKTIGLTLQQRSPICLSNFKQIPEKEEFNMSLKYVDGRTW